MNALALIGGSLLAAGVAVALGGPPLPALIGLAICLPPAVLTLVLVEAVCRTNPGVGPAAAMAATGMRMAWAAVAVSVLGTPVESLGIPRRALAEWTVGLYLVTLALETAVLWGRLSRTDRPKGPPA